MLAVVTGINLRCFRRAALIALCSWSQHNAAMPTSITIRDVPDETRDELAARAAATGRSLQEYLRSKLIDLARQPDAEALLAEVRARKAATAPALPRDRILAHQLEDRR
jgi:plasmid stability protein